MMPAVFPLWAAEIGRVISWSIIHFLWMGAAIWVVIALMRYRVRGAAPQVRYSTGIVALGLLVAGACFSVLLAGVWQPDSIVRVAASIARAGLSRASLETILPVVWAIGAGVISATTLAGLAGARRLRTCDNAPAERRISECCSELAKQLKISQHVAVAVSHRIRLPILIGVFRPVILLPAAAVDWTMQQAELILLHELAHVQRRDNLVLLLQRAVESVLWFHPAVWSASRWINEEREYCCDDFVLSITGRREAYADTLIRLAEQNELNVAAAFGRAPVLLRVRRILFHEERNMSKSIKWEAAALAVSCFGCCLALAAPPAPINTAARAPAADTAPADAITDTQTPQAAIFPVDATAKPPIASPPQFAGKTQILIESPAQATLQVLAGAKRAWGPEQAAGKPDTTVAGDVVTAWASLTADEEQEWLICEFREAVTARAIAVHETYNPGALIKVTAFNKDNAEVVAWEGEDPTPRDKPKGVSVIPIKLDFEVKRIKLYIDSPAVPGWNEIDAVGLEDDQGATQFAMRVESSSTYAQPGVASVDGKRSWGPEQAAGEPDTTGSGDYVTAWASATEDGQQEWLICEYETPQKPDEIVVHETFNPGGVFKITAFDSDDKETLIWEGKDPTPSDQPRGVSVFPVRLRAPVKKIKVYIDSPGVAGWNEIDAVGMRLKGEEAQWASKVEASSTYAQAAEPSAIPDGLNVVVAFQQFMQLREDVQALQAQMEALQSQQLKQQHDEIKQLRAEISDLKALLKARAEK